MQQLLPNTLKRSTNFIIKMKKYIAISILSILLVLVAAAQREANPFPYTLRLAPTEIPGMPGLQSFAYATWQGKWLLIGGRNDGLHRRQPFASFDETGQNRFIYVVDPARKKVWKRSLDKFPVAIAEQLMSTNMEFCQIDNKLILAGGYGYSKSADGHITYPALTVIKADLLIYAIVTAMPIKNMIVQISDERMAVTGGRLALSLDTLMIAGGQRFDGSYNPMGPDHGPGFTQQYTNEIRKFRLEFENDVPVIKNYSVMRDSINLHRRDYNLVPQVFKNEVLGYTMYSGVFQYNQDLPFTNFVDITGGTYYVNNQFSQKYSHYHNAVLPIYEKTKAAMYSIFLGGIAQYYPGADSKPVNDKDVPFTRAISAIIRKGNTSTELILPLQMPGYTGAAAEFIFAPNVKMFTEGIADADLFGSEEVLVGYIVGGIKSSARNIFWDNTGKESKATNKLTAVYIKRNG